MDSHDRNFSGNRKRQVLIVEDELINQLMLEQIVQTDFDTLLAASGAEAMEQIRTHGENISTILLDLNLPDMHGFDIIREVRSMPSMARIPVIVMTSDKEAEVESLEKGAVDFIPKPYPAPPVVIARINRIIELSEDKEIISKTERDELTGLYNREYFYSYAERMDSRHKEIAMDAAVININHFHIINERYGRAYGDDVLRAVAKALTEEAHTDGGLVCRREADTFLVYAPHRSDYEKVMERLSEKVDARVRLRMGVYSQADKSIDIERRFDRAKMAADTVRGSFTRAVAIYDNALHEAEMFAEQLLEEFPAAIEGRQFAVYYQPKYNILPQEPVLGSAEALVRWKHPRLGMISPGVFIPLLENNGLIEQLDSYVWREAARQMVEWKDRLGISVPVSVNVSRVDMFDPELVKNLEALVTEFGLDPAELLLEITESAYTQDSGQIVDTVNRLRECGFRVEMDDFGSGYSSLNMLSTLPVDALKLDMQFMRNAFKNRKNTRMLEVVVDIADSLEVPTIAEGVETAEQLMALKSIGCDVAQGYYFSRPVPPEEFEPFLLAKKNQTEQVIPDRKSAPRTRTSEKYTYDALHDPLTGLYNYSAYEVLLKDANQSHIAVMIANIDDFEAIRRMHGQEVTDAVVLRVAEVLRASFRSVDYICRISSSDFVVIVTRVNSSMRHLITEKVERLNRMLREDTNNLPPISLSVGVAFADRENPQGDILQDADTALFHMREMKRTGCTIY